MALVAATQAVVPATEAVANYVLMRRMEKLGDVIQDLVDDVHKKGLSIIAAGSGAVSFQQMNMLNHFMLLLHNFQMTFSDEMGKTIGKVDDVVAQRLAQIDSLVDKWTKGLLQDDQLQAKLRTYEGYAQALFEFVGSKPVVTGISPTCIAPSGKNSHVMIQCLGLFPEGADPALSPIFICEQQVFKPVNNIGVMEFAIPYEILFKSRNQPLMSVGFHVRVPYRMPEPDSIGHLDYKGWLSLLPRSPGTISLQYTVVQETVKTEARAAHFWQDSRPVKKGGVGYSMIDQPYSLYAGEGWQIVPNSSRVLTHTVQGNATARLQSEGPAAAVFLVTTQNKKVNGFYGRIECELQATAVKTTQVFEPKIEQLHLQWGETFQINPSKHKNWKVTFVAFDGTKREYFGNVEDTFVSIQSPQGMPILSLKVPRTPVSYFQPAAKL